MRIIITLLVLIFLIFGGWYAYKNIIAGFLPSSITSSQNIADLINKTGSTAINETDFPLTIPAGTKLSIYAQDLDGPRDLELDPNGNVIVSIPGQGRVVLFTAHRTQIGLLNNLNNPHGLAMHCSPDCYLYIAEESQVSRFSYSAEKITLGPKEVLFSLPTGGRHSSRSLLIQDDKLYTSTGSSCDTCMEGDKRRAAVYVSNLDGTDFKPFATGLRNSVFLTQRPGTMDIWATEMGRDFLGDNLPPDEINILREGFYGWPYCYGKNVHDTTFEDSIDAKSICKEESIASHIDLQAHSAPLGLDFLDNDTLLVAYHGSWNRSIPTGYAVTKFELDENGNEISRENFISGWQKEGEGALGRPVDILVENEHTVYISDDKAGVIYLLEIE